MYITEYKLRHDHSIVHFETDLSDLIISLRWQTCSCMKKWKYLSFLYCWVYIMHCRNILSTQN